MNIFEQVEAMHQQVREFVEKEYPEFKVTQITRNPPRNTRNQYTLCLKTLTTF